HHTRRPPRSPHFPYTTLFRSPRDRGFFDKRNDALAPNIKNVYPKALTGDTSVVLFWSRIGLAYRTDAVAKKPTSWKDFWDAEYRSEEHTSELQSRENLVCRLL